MKNLHHILLRRAVLIIFFVIGFNAQAKIKIGDLYYELNEDGTARVTYSYFYSQNGYNSAFNYEYLYGSDVVIPSTVDYKGKTYTVNEIGYAAFRYAPFIDSVTLPETVLSIDDYAFYKCGGLSHVNIPNSVTKIGKCAFYDCLLSSITNLSSVTYIGECAFKNCRLKNLTIPNSVKYIGDYAFGGTALSSIIIPNTVEYFGSAFENCKMLESVQILCEISEIQDYTFSGCERLTSVDIPNTIYTIGKSAFEKCRSLKTISIPNSVKTISESAFEECENLTDIIIPNNVNTIEDCAFKQCVGLKTISIPNSVTTIGEQSFEGCSSLTEIVIPNSIVNIERESFKGCISLSKIFLPKSIKKIGERAFLDIPKGSRVYIEDINEWSMISLIGYDRYESNPIYYAKCFYSPNQDDPIKHLVINQKDENVADYTFYGAENLETIRLNVDSIGFRSFGRCSNLIDLCINTNYISEEAFLRNDQIQRIFSLTSTPPVAFDNSFHESVYAYDQAFSYPHPNTILYVPKGSRYVYGEATCWKRFPTIIECDFSDIDEIFAADYDCGNASVSTPVVDAQDFDISIGNGTIVISTTNISLIQVYDLYGRCIHNGYGSISLNVTPGMYIVKTGNNTKKVIVK